MNSTHFSLRAMALMSLCLAALACQPALARDRHATVTGPSGKTASTAISRNQGDVSRTVTNGQGATVASRQVDRSATGTSGTMTGPQGHTATRETTRSDGGSTTTVAGPDGKTGSLTVSR